VSDAVNLAPRTVGDPRRRTSRRLVAAVLVGLAALVVFLIWFLVQNSSAFYEADQAVSRRADLGDRRIQLLGSPVTTGVELADIEDGQPGRAFAVAFEGVTADVVFVGNTADLFQPDVPVVLEGAWVNGAAPVDGFECGANDGWYFRADRMLVKHDDEYRDDRVTTATDDGHLDCSVPAGGAAQP
jgi:cytochrome c-type biogenesis protein CcmE